MLYQEKLADLLEGPVDVRDQGANWCAVLCKFTVTQWCQRMHFDFCGHMNADINLFTRRISSSTDILADILDSVILPKFRGEFIF